MSLLRRRRTDAHEGPVYVPRQDRLYFATKPDVSDAAPRVAIRYWDLATDAVRTWVPDARMANGMSLSCDASCLLVCEQGDRRRRAAITRYRLRDAAREVIIDGFESQPFNSPNKAVELRGGTLVFSDPDYGPRQGFRQNSPLTPALYAHLPTGETYRVDLGFEQPHGLATSPDHARLYVTDTSADDGTGGFDESRQRDIYAVPIDFEPRTGFPDFGTPEHLARVPVGIPDGMAVAADGRLYAGTGDGVRVYAPDGTLLRHVAIAGGAVSVCLDEERARMFVTTDVAVEVYEA